MPRQSTGRTQTYNDGSAHIYRIKNIAEPGAMPVDGLIPKIGPLRYAMRKVGVTRYYAGLQANVRVDFAIRIPRQLSISTQDVCVLRDGHQYQIVQVQHPVDAVPPSTDLALQRLEQMYAIHPIR